MKWALQHKDELGINKEYISIATEYQAIPELKEMILDELSILRKKKGGTK